MPNILVNQHPDVSRYWLIIQLLTKISPSKKPQMTLLDFLALSVFCLPSFLLFSTTGSCSCLLIQIIQSPNFSLSSCQPIIFTALFHSVFQCPGFCVSMYLANLRHSSSHIFCPCFQFQSHQTSCPNFCKSWVFLWVHVCRLREDYCWLLIIDRIHFPVHDYSQIN